MRRPMARNAKEQPAPPPPPSLEAAYEALRASHDKLAAELTEANAQLLKASPEPLRTERDDLKARCEQLQAQAEASRNAAALAPRELAVCEAQLKSLAAALPAPPGANPYDRDPSARTFLYVKGNPREPASLKQRVRAQTQRQADELASAYIKDGYVFRGCVG
jgi:hypothetical protein